MRDWIPVPGTAKGRLALHALAEFGTRGYDAVGVGELAAGAGVTTGSLYHHFGSKLGLYRLVRDDVERRALDRMEGAAAARAGEGLAAVAQAALLVGFDFAVRDGFARLLSEPHPGRARDPVDDFLTRLVGEDRDPLGRILAAAWRASLAASVESGAAPRARSALAAVYLEGG
jgi:AcrR family transcriptional regulator